MWIHLPCCLGFSHICSPHAKIRILEAPQIQPCLCNFKWRVRVVYVRPLLLQSLLHFYEALWSRRDYSVQFWAGVDVWITNLLLMGSRAYNIYFLRFDSYSLLWRYEQFLGKKLKYFRTWFFEFLHIKIHNFWKLHAFS